MPTHDVLKKSLVVSLAFCMVIPNGCSGGSSSASLPTNNVTTQSFTTGSYRTAMSVAASNAASIASQYPSLVPQTPQAAAALQRSVATYCQGSGNGSNFWDVEVCIASGNQAAARNITDNILKTKVNNAEIARQLFAMWPMMDAYIRFNEFFTPSEKSQIQQIITSFPYYNSAGATTSNMTLIGTMLAYLGHQAWPTATWTAVRNPSDPTGAKYVTGRCNADLADGMPEFASEPYGVYNLFVFATLSELANANDGSNVQQCTTKTYNADLGSLAGTWLDGQLVTVSGRSYPDISGNNTMSAFASALSVVFGTSAGMEPEIENSLTASLLTSFTAANSKIVLLPNNPGTMNIANDRSTPYVWKSTYNINDGYSTTFMTSRYGVFSARQANHHSLFSQIYPFGVRWIEPQHGTHNFLWVDAPVYDVGNFTNYTHGVAESAQYLQDKGSFLYLNNPSATQLHKYTLAFIPGKYLNSQIDPVNHRLFLQYENDVYIALSSSAPFDFIPGNGNAAEPDRVYAGDSTIQINGNASGQVAVAVDTASPLSMSFSDFISSVSKNAPPVVATAPNGSLQATYTDINDSALRTTFLGTDSISGQEINYKAWPGLSDPWQNIATASANPWQLR